MTAMDSDFSINHVDFQYVAQCTDAREMRKIVTALEKEYFPDLLREAKAKLAELDPRGVPVTFGLPSKQETQEAAVDVSEWESETRETDEKIRSHTTEQQPTRNLPPVRGTGGEKQGQTLTIDPTSELEAQAIAENEKFKGNECVYAKEWPEALEFYSRSIQVWPHSAAVYTNRALVRQKLKQWDLSVEDCVKASQVDPKFFKPYLRKGTALIKLERYAEAKTALNKALELAPERVHPEIRQQLKKAKPGKAEKPSVGLERWQEQEEKQKMEADRAPAKKGMKKMMIVEDDSDEESDEEEEEKKQSAPAEPWSRGSQRVEIIEDDEDEEEDVEEIEVENTPKVVEVKEEEKAEEVEEKGDSQDERLAAFQAEISATASLLAKAEACKVAGNGHFSSSSYDQANEQYEKAIAEGIIVKNQQKKHVVQLDAFVGLYQSNLSASAMQLGQHRRAAESAVAAVQALKGALAEAEAIPAPERAVQVKKWLVKALLRQAFAQEGASQMSEAEKALRDLLSLDYTVQAAREALPRIRQGARQQRELRVGDYKAKGNTFFKKAKWADAAAAYTTALVTAGAEGEKGEEAPKSLLIKSKEAVDAIPALYSNRALAQLKGKKWAVAESDCNKGLARVADLKDAARADSLSAKILHRRGLAREGLGKLADAERDLAAAQQKMPSAATKAALEKVRAAQKKDLETTKKKMTKLQIVEDDDDDSSDEEEEEEEVVVQQKAPAPKKKKSKIQIVEDDDESSDEEDEEEEQVMEQKAVEPKKAPAVAAKPTPAPSAPSKATEASSSAADSPAALAESLSLPRTRSEFERAVRSLASDSVALGRYIQRFNTKVISTLFQSSMSPDHVQSIVVGLHAYGAAAAPSHALSLLGAVTKAARFSLNVMMLPGAGKKALKGIFSMMGGDSRADQQEVARLAKLYKA